MNSEAQQWLEQSEQDLQTAHILEQTARYARSDSELGYDKATAQEALKQAQTVLDFAKGILK